MDQKQEAGGTQEEARLQVFQEVLAAETEVTLEVYKNMWAWQQVFIEAIDENLNAHGKEEELKLDREYFYSLIIWIHQVTLEPPVAKRPHHQRPCGDSTCRRGLPGLPPLSIWR